MSNSDFYFPSGCFLFCWTPFFVVHTLRALCLTCDIPPALMSTVTWLGYVNSALNPIIYTIFNTEFKKFFKKCFRSCCWRQVSLHRHSPTELKDGLHKHKARVVSAKTCSPTGGACSGRINIIKHLENLRLPVLVCTAGCGWLTEEWPAYMLSVLKKQLLLMYVEFLDAFSYLVRVFPDPRGLLLWQNNVLMENCTNELVDTSSHVCSWPFLAHHLWEQTDYKPLLGSSKIKRKYGLHWAGEGSLEPERINRLVLKEAE